MNLLKSMTKEQKQMVILGIMLTVGVLAALYQFVITPAKKTFKKDQAELSDLRGKIERGERAIEGRTKLEMQCKDLTAELKRADEYFIPPKENTLSWATEFMSRTARGVGVDVETVTEARSEPVPWATAAAAKPAKGAKTAAAPGRVFVPYAVRLATTCSYFDFIKLLEALEKSNPYIFVSEITITAQPSDPLKQRIVCQLEWPTWRGKPGSEYIRGLSKAAPAAAGTASP